MVAFRAHPVRWESRSISVVSFKNFPLLPTKCWVSCYFFCSKLCLRLFIHLGEQRLVATAWGTISTLTRGREPG